MTFFFFATIIHLTALCFDIKPDKPRDGVPRTQKLRFPFADSLEELSVQGPPCESLL